MVFWATRWKPRQSVTIMTEQNLQGALDWGWCGVFPKNPYCCVVFVTSFKIFVSIVKCIIEVAARL